LSRTVRSHTLHQLRDRPIVFYRRLKQLTLRFCTGS